MPEMATVTYIGDKIYFMTHIQPHGRICFNRHNGYKLPVLPSVAESLMRQYGKFFVAEMPVEPEVIMEEVVEEPVTEVVDDAKRIKRERFLENMAKGREKRRLLKEQGLIAPKKKRRKK